MDQDPHQENSIIKRHPGGFDIKLVLIFITLVLFAVALYFEYQDSGNIEYAEYSTSIETASAPEPQPESQSKPAPDVAYQFYQATRLGDLNKMHSIVAQLQSHEINTVTNGMTPIMKASSLGREDIVMFLLQHGADPNKRGSSSRTALQYAAERNRLAVARLLIAHGADINGFDNTHLTPLIMAADRRYHDFAMYLVDAGAFTNIRSPLMEASIKAVQPCLC